MSKQIKIKGTVKCSTCPHVWKTGDMVHTVIGSSMSQCNKCHDAYTHATISLCDSCGDKIDEEIKSESKVEHNRECFYCYEKSDLMYDGCGIWQCHECTKRFKDFRAQHLT